MSHYQILMAANLSIYNTLNSINYSNIKQKLDCLVTRLLSLPQGGFARANLSSSVSDNTLRNPKQDLNLNYSSYESAPSLPSVTNMIHLIV